MKAPRMDVLIEETRQAIATRNVKKLDDISATMRYKWHWKYPDIIEALVVPAGYTAADYEDVIQEA